MAKREKQKHDHQNLLLFLFFGGLDLAQHVILLLPINQQDSIHCTQNLSSQSDQTELDLRAIATMDTCLNDLWSIETWPDLISLFERRGDRKRSRSSYDFRTFFEGREREGKKKRVHSSTRWGTSFPSLSTFFSNTNSPASAITTSSTGELPETWTFSIAKTTSCFGDVWDSSEDRSQWIIIIHGGIDLHSPCLRRPFQRPHDVYQATRWRRYKERT